MVFPRSRTLLFAFAALCSGAGESHAIVSGTAAGSGEFPWMAGIVKKGEFVSTALLSGGALVGDQWVVTAAHSMDSESPSTIEVWIGMTDLGNPSSRVVRNVLAIYRHPDFITNGGQSEADVALLLLDQPVSGIPTLPILDDIDTLAEGDALTVAGFGTTDSEVLTPSQFLLKGDAEIVDSMSMSSPFSFSPQSSRLAAVDPDEESTPCRGDSGGPLIKNIDGADTLVGIVSFGSADCDPAIPSVYTNVAFYATWIQPLLALTATAPIASVSGRNRVIANNDGSPREKDLTDFGERRSSKTHTFTIQNQGSGLLTIRSADESHRNFSIRTAPATIVQSGSATSIRVTYKPRKRPRKSKTWVRLFTNDPAAPVYTYRVLGRSGKGR